MGSGSKIDWWNYIYYRNYKVWNSILTDEEINALTLSHDITVFDSKRATAFFKFADLSPFQSNHITSQWVHDPDRVFIDPPTFAKANSFFNHLPNSISTPTSILHLYYSTTKDGLALTVPVETLRETRAFTVELWVAFEDFARGNYSIVGVPSQPWNQGFSIAGAMRESEADVSCVLDTGISAPMSGGCYAGSKLCASISALNVWLHLLCSRSDLAASAAMVVGDEKFEEQNIVYKATVEELFSAGEIILGTKHNKATNERTRGFNGYVRELRFWSSSIDPAISKHMERERLRPLEHGALIKCWPLLDGSMADIAEHTVESEKENHEFSGEWVSPEKAPEFVYCRKGYMYSPKSLSCVLKKEHVALYFDGGEGKSCDHAVPKGDKKQEGDGVTLSIWVYLRKKISGDAVFIGLAEAAEIRHDSLKLKGYLNGIAEFSAGYIPPVGRWVHYSLAASKALGAAHFFYDGAKASTVIAGTAGNVKDFSSFIVGKNVVGFVREAKVWSTCLVKNVDGSVDVAEILREKF